ncbi:hypothetical protein GCM10007301_12320 [Azorhizobium oxalatiphilum]|uniref:Carrier domain-containing protein n=1 Tax=Azorhizobium oxalatiphilum TaxID=980631 RepID=A0A917BPU9_9HYPH|nr:non-ribosomal peptide synthetase [Azorhizobium oxalatiphilum]GGF54344.1 hypothetical protein GCM10007301_12320 [Azorhizobium oxalatiphilum]
MSRQLRSVTVHGAFSWQAWATPSATAILDRGTAFTYEDMDRRSNKLARYLQSRGVHGGSRVALVDDRSVNMIIAMLAVLKAGACFVPLDPASPCARLESMLRDAAPVLVLGRVALAGELPPGRSEPFLNLDAAVACAELQADHPLPERSRPEDPAYVMYTSGSTGQPKGVVVPHRAIVRLVSDQTYARFAPDEVFLHLAPLAFDASTFEIWGALLNGASLAVVPQPQPSVDEIVDAIARFGATTAWFTAGLFHLLVDHRLEGLRPLRQILAGGDVISPAHVRRARAALPHCRFINGYGPTENTTFSCCHDIRPEDEDGPLPVGRAITHSTATVRDEALRPVADGEVGQLCVGGEGLAIGYLNDPALTASRFVAAPDTGARIYLTGDQARRRPDGTIEFLGRMDGQVKIDGKRVELSEIEIALRAEPGVVDAAVVACEVHRGVRQLVAFLIARPGLDAGALHVALSGRLREQLPGYMVPSAFHFVSVLPLTPNGKIDRRALDRLARDRQPVEPRKGPPLDEGEEEVARIWSAVLKRDFIPRDANFFDLGGTSLLLMEVHARLKAADLTDAPLLALFAHPTIARFARHLRGEAEEGLTSACRAPAEDARRAALQRMKTRSLEQIP